jgi:HK97 gp10 family phage protein
MKVEMEFQGLQELLKAFEDAASDAEIAEVNRKIVEKSEPVVKKIMSGKIPKSADIKKSGRGFGTKSSVSTHAADSVPMGKPKVKGAGVSAEVGWDKSDNSEHFYVKFINWGTIYQPPREFIYATGRDADSELQKIAEQEYQTFLDNTIK